MGLDYSESITATSGINMVESVVYRMPEVDRASTYLPYEMDCEYVMWDCDNVSVDTDWEEEDD